jgi:poly(A) polymerase
LGNYDFVKRKLEELPPEQLKPQRLLTGDDLIQAGYTPGENFRKMLEAAEDAQLEQRIGTKDEALALIRDLFGVPGETK